jgi:phosphatidylserine decarboxylase
MDRPASPLFADDGCVIPNIRIRNYRVTLIARCEHAKIRALAVTVAAASADSAEQFVREHYFGNRLVIDEVTELAS